MCQKCLIHPLPDRDRFVSETGAYLINYNKCVHCNNKTIIKSGKINREENDGEEGENGNGDDDYEEIISYHHYCSSCDHLIAEHYYKFSLQKINADDSGELGKSSAKKSQEYLMECLLCGKGADSVVLYPMKKKNSVSEEIIITGNNSSSRSSGSNSNNNNNNNNNRNNNSNDNFDEKKENGLPDYNEFMVDSLPSSNSSSPPSIINADDTLISPDTGKMASFFMKNISIQKKFEEARQQQEKKIKMGIDRSSIVIIEKNDFITGKKISQGGKCEEKGSNENEGSEEKNAGSADDELNDFINCNDDALLADEHCDDDDQFDKISIEAREEGVSSISVEQRKFVVLMQSAEQEKEDVNDDEWQ